MIRSLRRWPWVGLGVATLAVVVSIASCRAEKPPVLGGANVVRLEATADVGLSDATANERTANSGRCSRLKLKNIQEMMLVRFDPAPVVGHEIRGAQLYLHVSGEDRLRYLRISTVNQDWHEGTSTSLYGPPVGATFAMADARPESPRPWAWPGSALCDVVMTSGHSQASWGQIRRLEDGWISVPVSVDLVHAMAVGASDGLAIMDGGNPANHNNMIDSRESGGNGPLLDVHLGEPLDDVPPRPVVHAETAQGRSPGTIRVKIEPAEHAFRWRVSVDGDPVERWRVPCPTVGKATTFLLDGLTPGQSARIEVVAVARSGRTSEPAEVEILASRAAEALPSLRVETPPSAVRAGCLENTALRLWPVPPLVKVSPSSMELMHDDMGQIPEGLAPKDASNAVWDGRRVRLFGARGEYVSFQVCVEPRDASRPQAFQVVSQPLVGPSGGTINVDRIELFRMWCARNRSGKLQPTYAMPSPSPNILLVSDPEGKSGEQRNQTIYVDIHIPKEAPPGEYAGALLFQSRAGQGTTDRTPLRVPLVVEVLDFELPDRLAFWVELNAYGVPSGALAYYRLAHQHRCVLNCVGGPRPSLSGRGADIRVGWDKYDQRVGALLSGDAFLRNRRAGVPVECMYLPFADSWPTPLSPDTYDYQGAWTGGKNILLDHYLKSPYIGRAFSRDYLEAFVSVQQQFIEHFQRKGYTQTEMQCFFGSKITHRLEYGLNTWWSTDEPYHWDDWLAVQFFGRLWAHGRGQANPRQWPFRADISRPQWQGRTLAGVLDIGYFGAGGFTGSPMVRRCQWLRDETRVGLRSYGSVGPDNASNTVNVTAVLSAYCNGADAFLPWQTLGTTSAMDTIDAASRGGGASVLVPCGKAGGLVVGDVRLKGLRDAEQLIEYLAILARRRGLSREQIREMASQAIYVGGTARANAGVDNADAVRFAHVSAEKLTQLRRRIVEEIVDSGTAVARP